MKKLLILLLTCSATLSVARMTYDPVTRLVYSLPKSSKVNPVEYNLLVWACIGIDCNMHVPNCYPPTKKESLHQYSIYLKRIGTPTALRLLDDLKKGKLFYANGAVMGDLFDN